MQLAVSRSISNSFGGDLHADTTGFLLGPYLSYRMSPAWSVYGALGVGQQSNDTQVLSLSGTAKAMQYNLSLQAEGQYAMGAAYARPKIQLNHTYTAGNNYELAGNILGTPVSINMRNDGFQVGAIQPTVEINRTYDLGNNKTVMPYVEAGFFYQYARPNSGQVLTSNLTSTDSTPWGGLVRAGARSLLGKTTMVKAEIGYQSLGIKDLSVWGLQLFLSHSF